MVEVGEHRSGYIGRNRRVLGFLREMAHGKELRTLRLDRKTSTIRHTRCVRSFRYEVQDGDSLNAR